MPNSVTSTASTTTSARAATAEAEENWQFAYLPIPTKQCDTCAMRRGMGKVPTCVQHCQSKCIEFGKVDELAAGMDEKQQTLFVVG